LNWTIELLSWDDTVPTMSSAVRTTEEGAVVEIYVQPRASRNEIVGIHEGRLKVRLTAPPVEGEANKDCIRFLAKLIGVPRSSVVILQGHKTRAKTLLIRGVTSEQVVERLPRQG
jgi:uncharacterized protein (TIGR00251 family)